MIGRTVGAALLAAMAPADVAVAQDVHQEGNVKADVTIYLDAPILGEGGTVFVLPKEVPIDAWRESPSEANPARNDAYVARTKPLGPGDRRIGATVHDTVSIVTFEYPKDGSFVLRFAPDPQRVPGRVSAGTRQIGIGSGSETDPVSGETETFPKIMTFHVIGSKASEEDSRRVESTIRLSSLEQRYSCRRYESALACDASRDATNE